MPVWLSLIEDAAIHAKDVDALEITIRGILADSDQAGILRVRALQPPPNAHFINKLFCESYFP